MVRIGDSDGNEYDYEQALPEDVEEQIRKAGPEMLSSINAAKEIFLTMNVSPEVVGDEVSKILTELRETVVFRLIVFREQLLPLSRRTVREVETTLKLYFQNTSFEEFKILLPTLRGKLEPCKKRAGVAKNKFMLLAADMEAFRIQGDKDLQEVIPKLKDTLNLNAETANKWKKSAQAKDMFVTPLSLGVLGGLGILVNVIAHTGDLIIGIPALTPVIATSIALARMRKEEGSNVKHFSTVCSQVSGTLETVKDINTRCIAKFAVCLQGCVDFFGRIQSELDSLQSSADDEYHGDDPLKIIHRNMKNQADQVVQACIEYGRCASQVESGIQVLDKFKPEKYRKKVEEWAKWADKEVEEMPTDC